MDLAEIFPGLPHGRASPYPGDEKYACEFVAQLDAWIEQNPLRVGSNWISAMECTVGVGSWRWTYLLFQHSPALGPALGYL